MYSRQVLNSSNQVLNGTKNKRIEPITQQNKIYQKQRRKARNQGLTHLYNDSYKPAIYKKALEFKNSHSYKRKMAENTYKQIQLFQDTNQLKSFGLGPYFFIQFQRRIVWLFLIFSLIEGVRIYINVKGAGLQNYKGSFGTYLVSTTIGNFDGDVLSSYDKYILTIIPCVVYAIFFLFFLFWKCHYYGAIKEQDQSRQFIKPQKFCVEIQGFDQNDDVKQEELQELFSSFGPVYEVSLAREYSGNLKYFQQLDELQQEIRMEQLQIILGSGDQQSLKQFKKQKDELTKYVNTLRIKPSVRSAFIHYQFQKSKVEMLQYYSNHYLFNHKGSHSIARAICCCCIDEPQPKFLYKGKKLYVKNQKIAQPEDINWNSYQIGCCGKVFRILFSALIILAFLAVSCAIIGLCSVAISAYSVNCQGITIPTSVANAQSTNTSEKQKKCFCSANFIASFTNTQIQTYCKVQLNRVYTQQGIQYAITATSTIVNIIFGIIVGKLVQFTQPAQLSTGYLWKNSIMSIFFIFNTVFLPLLIYAQIFGFTPTKYVSFITIISADIKAIFNVDSIKLYVDFSKIWYRNVSPIFVNYIILDIIITWVAYIFLRCCCTKQNLQSKQGTILQKTMNEQIISWKLNAADQFANFNLIIFLSTFYSAGIPALIPLGFINLFSKYVTNRSLLQNVSSRIDGLSQGFNSFPFTMLPFLLVISCVVGEWMLTGNELLLKFTNMKITIESIQWDVLQRQLIYPFYIILAIVILFQFLFYNTIIRFCSWLSECCHDKKQVVHPYYTRQYAAYAKTMSIVSSYNIRNNLKYKNAIINLQKYLEGNQLKM